MQWERSKSSDGMPSSASSAATASPDGPAPTMIGPGDHCWQESIRAYRAELAMRREEEEEVKVRDARGGEWKKGVFIEGEDKYMVFLFKTLRVWFLREGCKKLNKSMVKWCVC